MHFNVEDEDEDDQIISGAADKPPPYSCRSYNVTTTVVARSQGTHEQCRPGTPNLATKPLTTQDGLAGANTPYCPKLSCTN